MHRPDPGAFMDLFRPDAPWQHSASKVNVFQISTQFVLSSTDEDLVTFFNDMKRRGIPVGISMGAAERETTCGAGEGYLPANIVDIVAFEQFGLAQLQSFQSNPATRLDDILIESWQPRPSKFLPETEPGTSTNILLRAEAMLANSK